MAITRYTASADTTITNAYKENLSTRGTGSNMGEAEVLEVFSIYAQATTSSVTYQGDLKNRERARFLVQFPTSDISTDRTAGLIPASGSVVWVLKLYNARHTNTLPDNFTIDVEAVNGAWEEGYGIDMNEYEDLTHDVDGANWIKRAGSTAWSSAGGDIHASPSFSQEFSNGREDLEIDISDLVEEWLPTSGHGTKSNHGIRFSITAAQETSTARSYYTKKFFSRQSNKFFLKPTLEAQWDSSLRDDSANFYASSSIAPAADNLNTIYFYNNLRGRHVDIGALGANQSTATKIHLKLYPSLGGVVKTLPLGGGVDVADATVATGSWVETGIYSATLAFTGSETTVYPVWETTAGVELYSGSAITVNKFSGASSNEETQYVTTITNLKKSYTRSETARFRLYIRPKDWSPTVYTVSSTATNSTIIPEAFWKLSRVKDDFTVVDYGTGSTNYTKMSYDSAGSYFDFDMSNLEDGYAYNLKFIYKINDNYHEQPETFKFRVD